MQSFAFVLSAAVRIQVLDVKLFQLSLQPEHYSALSKTSPRDIILASDCLEFPAVVFDFLYA